MASAPKYNNTLVLDQALNYVKSNATRLCLCKSDFTDPLNPTFTECTSTKMLAIKTISSSDFTGPATGLSGGHSRRITFNAQTTLVITNTGDVENIALVDFANSRVLYMTTCPSVSVIAAGSKDMPAFDIEYGKAT
jgi:hypothetical protein